MVQATIAPCMGCRVCMMRTFCNFAAGIDVRSCRVAADLYHDLSESCSPGLLQIVTNATVARSPRALAGDILGAGGWLWVWRTIGVTFKRNRGHADRGARSKRYSRALRWCLSARPPAATRSSAVTRTDPTTEASCLRGASSCAPRARRPRDLRCSARSAPAPRRSTSATPAGSILAIRRL